jgi:hypothetical protein
MSTTSYWIDVRHEGLHAYRRITGRDQYVVEAKAAEQRAVWEEKWAKIQKRERALYTKEQKKDAAAQRTEKAQDALAEIENLLTSAVEAKSIFEWEKLKDHSRFAQTSPGQPAKRDHPVEPIKYEAKYVVHLGLLDHLFSSRKSRKLAEAQRLYDVDHAVWETTVKAVDDVNVHFSGFYCCRTIGHHLHKAARARIAIEVSVHGAQTVDIARLKSAHHRSEAFLLPPAPPISTPVDFRF